MLVYVFYSNLFEFLAASLEKGLLPLSCVFTAIPFDFSRILEHLEPITRSLKPLHIPVTGFHRAIYF